MTIAHPRTTHEDEATRIREDAAAHPERSYSEHEEAARRIAAECYRRDLEGCKDAPEITYGEDV